MIDSIENNHFHCRIFHDMLKSKVGLEKGVMRNGNGIIQRQTLPLKITRYYANSINYTEDEIRITV